MGKIKSFLLLFLGILLVIFAVQNQQPAPTLKIFRFQVGTLPTFLLLYTSLILGFALGWVAHALRTRGQRRAAASVSTEEKQESQQGQQASQKK